jgi:hypothetical protein
MQQLEDALGAVEIAQRMLPQVPQARVRREHVTGEILRGQGENHLATVSRCEQARQPIQSCREVVAILWGRGGGMEGHPDGDGSVNLRPGLPNQ